MIKYKQITSLNWKKNIEKKIALKSRIVVRMNLFFLSPYLARLFCLAAHAKGRLCYWTVNDIGKKYKTMVLKTLKI